MTEGDRNDRGNRTICQTWPGPLPSLLSTVARTLRQPALFYLPASVPVSTLRPREPLHPIEPLTFLTMSLKVDPVA